MKFGKLPDISSVDFSLAADPAINEEVLAHAKKETAKATIYIGCTGWSMKEWVGKVYPKGAKSKDYLWHYARQFNTIELNTTHYRIPTIETVDKWTTAVTDDFRFCPKIPQSISHSRDFGMGSGSVLKFCESIMKMNDKLGCCFMQLPPYFGIDRIKILEVFFENFPKVIPLSVEFRHESWFNSDANVEAMLGLLRKTKKYSLITDVAGRRDVAHMGLTGSKVLIRFVGNDLHSTDYQRIDRWVLRLKKWIDYGLKEVYFFPHEPDNLLAPEMAAYLLQQIQKTMNVNVRGPKLLNEEEGEQMSLF